MLEPTATPAPGPSLLTALARSRVTRVLTTAWWVGVGMMAALAYLTTMTSDGLVAPLGGAMFMAGLAVVAAVARNASAEAAQPGSVRRGSLLRAAGLGAIAHGGLLAAAVLFQGSAIITGLLVVAGAGLVAVTRPTTLVALGSPMPAEAPAADGERLSTPQIVSELQSTAVEVRTTADPQRRLELAERRGELLAVLAERDPESLMMLVEDLGQLDEESVRPSRPEGPDGPAIA